MSGLTFAHLHAVNADRCINGWNHRLEDWSLSDWLIAIGGEVGEALNVVKKLNRERDGIIGNTVSPAVLMEALADELADAVIYIDLIASRLDVEVDQRTFDEFRTATEQHMAPAAFSASRLGSIVLLELGDLAGVLADVEDGCKPRMKPAYALGRMVRMLDALAAAMGIDLGQAVVSKFNRTSEKHGMPHRLVSS